MKIMMLVPVWRRPDVLKLFIDSMEQTLPPYATLLPVFIVSPEDPDIEAIKLLLKRYSKFWFDNQPLGRKKNAGLSYAMQYDWEYMIEFGSDDLWTAELWQLYRDKFDSLVPYFGVNNLYFYDYINNQASLSYGYHSNNGEVTAIGPGRCIRRDVIERVFPLDEPHRGLWRDDWSAGMDGISNVKLERHGYRAEVIDTGNRPIVCDVKTYTNLNIYIEVSACASLPVEVEWLRGQFHFSPVVNDTSLADFSEFSSTIEKTYQGGRMTKREAFDTINVRYELTFGEKRFKNYNSYKATISRRHDG